MVRDPRFLVCRAMFLLTPFGWAGYIVGVTKHLSLKDLLLEANKNIDDDYEGATHSLRDNIDEADIALLHTYLRIALGVFMIMMAFFVLIGVGFKANPAPSVRPSLLGVGFDRDNHFFIGTRVRYLSYK